MWIQVSGEREGQMRACHDPVPNGRVWSGWGPRRRAVYSCPGPRLAAVWGGAEGWARTRVCARVKPAGPEDTGADAMLQEALGQIHLRWPGTFLKMHLFFGEKDQERKMQLFGFQVNNVTCL